jgi:hypothetical protein
MQTSYSLGREQNFRWDKALEAAAALEDEELTGSFLYSNDYCRRQPPNVRGQLTRPSAGEVVTGDYYFRNRNGRAPLDSAPGICVI